jgi:hypothetical protein
VGRDYLLDSDEEERITLSWILRELHERVRLAVLSTE